MSDITSMKSWPPIIDLQLGASTSPLEGRPLEICSGAIWTSSTHKNLLRGQANTSKETWDLFAFQKHHQIDEDAFHELAEQLERILKASQPGLDRRRIPVVIPIIAPTPSKIIDYPVAFEGLLADDVEILENRQSSPNNLLAKLQDSSISQAKLFETILFAEIAAFDEPQTKALLQLLFEFVDKYRFSQDEDTKTAVGAAIRKLAMNLPDFEIEQYANLFHPTETDTLSCEIELELAKAILWRLTAQPASLSDDFPNLENCLAEIASLYLNSRLLLQKNYAAISLQAVLGILLLNSQHADHIIQSVRDMKISWFSDLLVRRLKRLRAQLSKINQTKAIAAATNLERFVSVVQCESI